MINIWRVDLFPVTRLLRIFILSIWATLLGPLPALGDDPFAEQVGRFLAEMDTLVDEADSTHTRPDRDRIERLYRDHFSDQPFREGFEDHTLDELVGLHNATEAAFFYTLSPWLLDRLGHLVAGLVERLGQGDGGRSNVATEYLERFQANLLRAHRFSQAQEFSERYELAAPTWHVIDETPTDAGPTVFEIETDRNAVTLRRTTVELARGPTVVAVVHPHCGPSRRAMTHIEGDPRLASLFAGRTVWLVDARQTGPIEPLVDWNAEARVIKVAISYDNYAWPPEIGFLRTPAFYFLRDGVVRDLLIGWPGPEQVALLDAAFDAIGIDPGIE